jgi:hypothetical protein
MTYSTSSNLTALTEYLSAYIVEEIGDTVIGTPLFEEVQRRLVDTIQNGIEAFCGGASPAGLRYEVSITADNADKPVVFEQWSASDIRESIEDSLYTKTDLPTLSRIDDNQLHELLEYCAFEGYSFYSSMDGLMLNLLEEMAEDYFRK